MYAPFVIHFCIWSQTDNFDFDGLRWPSRCRACRHAPVVPPLIQNYLRISGPHAKDRFLFPCTCLNSVEGNFCIHDFLCRPRTVLFIDQFIIDATPLIGISSLSEVLKFLYKLI